MALIHMQLRLQRCCRASHGWVAAYSQQCARQPGFITPDKGRFMVRGPPFHGGHIHSAANQPLFGGSESPSILPQGMRMPPEGLRRPFKVLQGQSRRQRPGASNAAVFVAGPVGSRGNSCQREAPLQSRHGQVVRMGLWRVRAARSDSSWAAGRAPKQCPWKPGVQHAAQTPGAVPCAPSLPHAGASRLA